MKYDVLSLGPARMDVFVQIPPDEVVEVCSMDRQRCMIELAFGEKIAVDSMHFSIGGNTGNNAVGLARLGLKPAIIGAFGDGWTDKQALEILKNEGVETKYAEIRPGKFGFGVVINYQGERTILSYYPPSQNDWPKDPELDASWIYLTSMGDGYENFYAAAVAWARERGVRIAFNPGTRQIKAGMQHLDYAYSQTDLLFVNKEEAATLLNKSVRGTNVKDLLMGLFTIGAKTVVITDGQAGTYAYDGQKYWHMPIVPAKVVERTGAGDAFGSGCLAAIISGKSIDEGMRWGTVNSASVLEYVGPQMGLLNSQTLQERMEKSKDVKVEEI
jgi:sugar/nucleoside kinase (ribokinase family)